MGKKGHLSLIVIVCLLLVLAGAAFFLLPGMLGAPPKLTLAQPVKFIGVDTKLDLKVENQGLGLDRVTVEVLQAGKLRPVAQQVAGPGQSGVLELQAKLKARRMGLEQGKATLVITAWDRPLFKWAGGQKALLELPVMVDTTAPRLAVLNRVIHVTRGGVGLAVYRLSEPVAEHGVMVGGKSYPGFTPWPKRPLTALCFFAYAQYQKKGEAIMAWASDQAGNQGRASLPVRLKWKRFRHDRINLSDRSLEAITARFANVLPAEADTPLKGFLYINTTLRKLNDARIFRLAAPTEPAQLWEGAFIRPRGKPMSQFGDRRTYFYKKRKVATGVHLGSDLADLAQSPVKATAAGKVLYAGPVGIYGNAVILDHGLGISTLYGHMSDFAVAKDDAVAKDQVLGRSGATGLALGDHLHFSVLLSGVFVNPTEWWDPHWINDNISRHLTDSGLPAPHEKP